MKTPYACWGCRTTFPRTDGSYFCPTCLPKRLRGEIDVSPMIIGGDSATRGYAGYNHGLGIEVKNKGHWKTEVQRHGLVPIDEIEVKPRPRKNVLNVSDNVAR